MGRRRIKPVPGTHQALLGTGALKSKCTIGSKVAEVLRSAENFPKSRLKGNYN